MSVPRNSRGYGESFNSNKEKTQLVLPTDIQSCVFEECVVIDTHTVYRAAKTMKTEVENIVRKQKKRQSKQLNGCKKKYYDCFTDLQNAVKEIEGALAMEQDRTQSHRHMGGSERQLNKRTRKGVQEPFSNQNNDNPTNECMRCISKDRKIRDMYHQLQQSEENTRLATGTIDELGDEIRRLKSSRSKLEEQIRRLEEQTATLKQQLQTERDQKDDALRRLSAMASSKLRDNNPNITDLSDQNRPTKIAEKLSELYDNQWTDAFDALQKDGKQDQSIIRELLAMFMDVFNECSRLAKDRFFEKVQDSIEFPAERKGNYRPVELPDQLKQQVKEFRRVRASKVIGEIQELVLKNRRLMNKSKDVQYYLATCVEIGWLAAVQDPPLVLMGKSPDRFDTNVFKDYTQRGPYVEYVVWPALLLHENGPMLAKGVAQGCSAVNPTSSPRSFNFSPTVYEPPKRQNADGTDRRSSAPKVSSRQRPAGNGAHFSQTVSARQSHTATMYNQWPSPHTQEATQTAL